MSLLLYGVGVSNTHILIGNWFASKYIPGTVGSVLGASFVSLGGSIYAWKYNGYAFAAMVPGVLILVPVSVNTIFHTTTHWLI